MSVRNLDHRPTITATGFLAQHVVRCACAPGVSVPFGGLDTAVAYVLAHVAEGAPHPGRFATLPDHTTPRDAA